MRLGDEIRAEFLKDMTSELSHKDLVKVNQEKEKVCVCGGWG